MTTSTAVSSHLSRRDFVRAAGLGVAALAADASLGSGTLRAFTQQSGLLIRGGLVVTAEGRAQNDVRVRGGSIAEIGRGLGTDGERVIDGDGLLVLPGGIDPHAHLTQNEPAPERFKLADDLTSGSEAALAGGVTTIGNMTVPGREQTLWEAIERDAEFVREKAIADIMLHPVLLDPTEMGEENIARLVEAGHTSIKIFMVISSFDEHLRDYVQVMRLAGAAGILLVVHCEDSAIIAEATRALVASGKTSLENFAHSRPLAAEVLATQRAIAYGAATGAPIYVVHLSAADPLQLCREARQRGQAVYVETRPVYLHLTSELYEGADGPLYVAQPPLRTPEDVEALWGGMADGSVHTLGTDHVGWSREQKLDPDLNVEDLRPGVPNLQEMLPLLHSEGVVKGRITLERFVEISSTNPARLFGLYPRKGTIAVGSDADLALWDPTEQRRLRLADMKSRGGFSLFDGWEVTGWPQMTIRRGEVVYENGRITAEPGSGELLKRGATQAVGGP